MSYDEILSSAQSLSEPERQSLAPALGCAMQCEARVPASYACHPCWKNRGAALIAAEPLLPFRQRSRNATLRVQGLRDY